MVEHRNALAPGHRVQWYEVREVLGQGGFGITYLAQDTNLGIAVAIKEYLPAEMAVREQDASVQPRTGELGEQFRWGLDRFISEAQTLARFKHPNIVRVFSVFSAHNTAYMVMEYEQGRGLHQLLKEQNTLPEAALRALYEPLLDGLEQVHAHGFIHRDIKPANIFLRADGSPVLLDFGSARRALGERTRTLTAMVSPGFAPFEQYSGKGERQGPWTDIYGLGATLYRAAVGRAPADAMDRSEALLRTGRDIYVGAAEIRPHGYSPVLLRAIDRALAFNVEHRPASIAAWRALLQETESSEATTAAAAGVPADTVRITMDADALALPAVSGPPPRRPWLRIAGAGMVIFLLLAVLGAIGKRRAAPDPVAAIPAVAQPVPTADPGVAASRPETDPVAVEAAVPPDAAIAAGAPPATNAAAAAAERDAPAADSAGAAARSRLAALQRRLRAEPGNRETRRALRDAVEQHERLARQAVRDGDYTGAEKYLLDVMQLAPDNSRLAQALAEVRRLKSGRPLQRQGQE